MHFKIRVVSIFVRQKYTRVRIDHEIKTGSFKRKLRLKGNGNPQNVKPVLTSKDVPLIDNSLNANTCDEKTYILHRNLSFDETSQNNKDDTSTIYQPSNETEKKIKWRETQERVIPSDTQCTQTQTECETDLSQLINKIQNNLDKRDSSSGENEYFDTNESITKSQDIQIKRVNSVRTNEVNMQMISKELHEQLFRNYNNIKSVPTDRVHSIKEELKKFSINIEDASRIPDVNIKIPSLEGKDLEEHFYNIAAAQSKPYLEIVNKILKRYPLKPDKWILQEGWTRYTEKGAEKVDYPLETGLVFDVEVCVKEGMSPVLATAVSNEAWYGWVSKSLIEGSSQVHDIQSITTDMLIPIESLSMEHGKKLNNYQKKPKIIVGHNVSYDRSRIKEQYWLNSTGTRFLDTMSLHTCVSGINSYQRALLKSNKYDIEDEYWISQTSLNSLAEVYNLYCNKTIDKSSRNIFVDGSLSDVKENFNELMTYCASDVEATHEVLCKLFPLFQKRFPHPVTFAGMLELGIAYLPVNSNWTRYLEESESTFEDLNYEVKFTLAKRADAVCQLMHNEKYKEDLWMWDQDWSTQNIKMKMSVSKENKEKMEMERKRKQEEQVKVAEKCSSDDENEEDKLAKEFEYLEETKYMLSVRVPHLPGYPAWYRKLCPKSNDENWAPGPQNISTSMQIVPKLLNLTWENYPLHYIREHGWGILVPYRNDPTFETKLPLKQLLEQCPLPKPSESSDTDMEYEMTNIHASVQKDLAKEEFWQYRRKKSSDQYSFYKGTGVWCNVDIDNCCYFFKLPHKDGAQHNVGNPLAKDFLNKFSENTLAGVDVSATQVLKLARMVSYWRNNRDRIMKQMVAWFHDSYLPIDGRRSRKEIRYGAIIPQVVVSGTLTRRAVEPTWMTASNAHAERVGSELRSMIQAPPGYNIVGADVDSQELWIASIIGDSYYAKIHGATPFGWMTLVGTKSNGTDMHSVTAKAVGISRDHAKVINYARIYGAGRKFAERLLKQFNPSMTKAEASSKAQRMFELTKGQKVYKLRAEFVNEDTEDRHYTTSEAYQIAKLHGKPLLEVFEKSLWIGGSESAMFNRLEEIASSEKPVTPFLNSRLSRALEGCGVDNEKYLPTKINWVVQSGAVDFLHLMLVSMRWLMRDNVRFCLSFHDEIRYLVPARYKYNAALAMHVTNLMTRAFCASRLGMKDLPMSVAFFAAVEVDTVLRKEAKYDCKTPSNPYGLEGGYGIPPGESLDVWKTLEKTGGSLGPWHEEKIKNVKSS